MNRTKIEHLVTCLATMPYVYTACPVCVTCTGGTGGKFQPVSITESHVLTLAARSYALLVLTIALYTHFEQSYLVS